jgi:hypothetical protein
LPRISAKNYYERLSTLAALGNLLRSEEGREKLLQFSGIDCQRFELPGAWLLTRHNVTAYAEAADETLRHLATIREAPRAGETASITLNLISAPLEMTLRDNFTVGPLSGFFFDGIFPALEGRDIRRIRICPICDQVFIAIRKDASACRGRCTNTNNKRKFDSAEARQGYRAKRKKYLSAKSRWERLKQKRIK